MSSTASAKEIFPDLKMWRSDSSNDVAPKKSYYSKVQNYVYIRLANLRSRDLAKRSAAAGAMQKRRLSSRWPESALTASAARSSPIWNCEDQAGGFHECAIFGVGVITNQCWGPEVELPLDNSSFSLLCSCDLCSCSLDDHGCRRTALEPDLARAPARSEINGLSWSYFPKALSGIRSLYNAVFFLPWRHLHNFLESICSICSF